MKLLEIEVWKIAFLFILFSLFLTFSITGTQKIRERWKRGFLLTMRNLSFILFSLAFLRLSSMVKEYSEKRGKIALFIDTSGSMFAGGEKSRINLLRDKIADFLNYFSESGAGVELFALDEKITPITVEEFLSLEDRGAETRIIPLLKNFAETRGGEYEGIVLFSDGIDTSEGNPEMLRELSLPLNLVQMPPLQGKDLWIEKVELPFMVFKKVPFSMRVHVLSKGINGRGTLKIYINGKLAYEKNLLIRESERNIAETELVLDEEGDFLVHIVLSPFPGEMSLENNSFTTKVKGVRDRIRVLQVVGTPTWDVRFLRRFLKKHMSVELISFMILRTHQDLLHLVPEWELSLIPFPSREIFIESVDTFDAIIFQNFNYAPYVPYGPKETLLGLKRAIETGKTGFIMLGGDRAFSRGEYGWTPLEEVLPVKFVNSPQPYIHGQFRIRLTEAGEIHPVTSFLKDEMEKLPPLSTLNVDLEPKRWGLVLLEERERKIPLLILGESGKGRSAIIASDSLWQWFFNTLLSDGFEVYTRLMSSLLNWVTKDPALRRIRVDDKREGLSMEVLNRKFLQCKECVVEMTVLSADGSMLEEMKKFTDSSGTLILKNAEIPSPSVLSIRAEGEEIHFPVTGKEKTEYLTLHSGRSILKNLSDITEGRFFKFEDFSPQDIKRLRRKTGIESSREIREIWREPLFIGVFFTIIILEWWLRRKWGLR